MPLLQLLMMHFLKRLHKETFSKDTLFCQKGCCLFFFIFKKTAALQLFLMQKWWCLGISQQHNLSEEDFLIDFFFVCFLWWASLSSSYWVVGHALAGEIADASVVLGVFVPRASEHAAAVLFTALCAGSRASRAAVCIQTPPQTWKGANN